MSNTPGDIPSQKSLSLVQESDVTDDASGQQPHPPLPPRLPPIPFGDVQGIINAYVERIEIGRVIGIDVSNDESALKVLCRERESDASATKNLSQDGTQLYGAIVAKRLMELEKLKSGPSISKGHVVNIDEVMKEYENGVLEVRAGYVTCFFGGKKKTGYIRDCEMDLLRDVPIWREQEGWTPELVQEKTLWVEIGDICISNATAYPASTRTSRSTIGANTQMTLYPSLVPGFPL